MENHKTKLNKLKCKLEFYEKLEKKLTKILNAELDVVDYAEEIDDKIESLKEAIEELE